MERRYLLSLVVGFAAVVGFSSDAFARNRMYHAELGRFLSRDPIETDPNLYQYCGNTAVNRTDPSGLRWNVTRDGNPRAEADNDHAADTVRDLALLTHLTAREYKAWLKSEDNKPLPSDENTPIGSCRKFSVPNTAYIDVATYTFGFFKFALATLESTVERGWQQEGLRIVYTGKYLYGIPFTRSWATRNDILNHLGSDDIYKYMYIGHGDVGGTLTGVYNEDNPEGDCP